MWDPAKPLVLTLDQSRQLHRVIRSPRTPQKVALRAELVLGAAEGLSNSELARQLGTSRPTVLLWRRRFQKGGVEGVLVEAPRPGRRKEITVAQIAAVLDLTLNGRPKDGKHWSTRGVAGRCGLSHMTVHRVWRAYGLQPHRGESFRRPTEPQSAAKVRDIVGLYLSPLDRALALSVGGKSQIQARDGTQAALALGSAMAERPTRPCERHDPATLFAALDVLTGRTTGASLPRHGHRELLRFLDRIETGTPKGLTIHLILDPYGTHTHPKVQQWLAAHRRYRFRFTPKGASWVDQVGQFLARLTRQRFQRGSFQGASELQNAMRDYLAQPDQGARPFVWTAPAARVIRGARGSKDARDPGP